VNDGRRRLSAALAALRVNETSYTWFGLRHTVLPTATAAALGPATVRRYLQSALQLRLYSDFYCPGEATPTPPARTQPPAAPSYRDALSAANMGTGCTEKQWRVLGIDGTDTVIERQGLRLWVAADELCDGPDVRPGVEVAVRLPNDLPHRSPGFYTALGDVALPDTDAGPLVRIYWNLTPAGAPHALRIVTTALNAARIPFRFKVADAPAGFARRDAGVLYLLARHYPTVAELLSARYVRLRDTLGPGTPAFTKQLAPGLALAEDPGDGGSFGLHRCGLVAQALVQTRQPRHRSPGARLAAVSEHLLAHGIDPDAPHLNPGSTGDYPVLAATASAAASTR
jgi:hypothetical protein